MKELSEEQKKILSELFSNHSVPMNHNNQNKKDDESSAERDKSEIITSVCIDEIVSKREAAISNLHTALKLLAEASKLAQDIGGDGLSISDLSKANSRYTELHEITRLRKGEISNPIEKIENTVIKKWDRYIWDHLMKKTNMVTIMDSRAKDSWYEQLEKGDFPEINKENIKSTFNEANRNKVAMFERSIVNLFKSLSWCYKSNLPVRFGDKIILKSMVSFDRLGMRVNYQSRDDLFDLERVFKVLDGKSIPEYNQGLPSKMDESFRNGSTCYKDLYFSIKSFKNGNVHVKFDRPELVNMVNNSLARFYGETLPPSH